MQSHKKGSDMIGTETTLEKASLSDASTQDLYRELLLRIGRGLAHLARECGELSAMLVVSHRVPP